MTMCNVRPATVAEIIKPLLEQNPELRDSDEKLIVKVWEQEMMNRTGRLFHSADEFYRAYSEGKIPNNESVRRARQRLQERHVELRGTLYNERHGLEEQVIEEVRSIM